MRVRSLRGLGLTLRLAEGRAAFLFRSHAAGASRDESRTGSIWFEAIVISSAYAL